MNIASLIPSATALRRAAGQRLGKRQRCGLAQRLWLESLEPRQMLAADVYVNDNWFVVSNNVGGPGLDNGDSVDNRLDLDFATNPQAHTFGLEAFSTIQAAVTAVESGGNVHVLQGTYVENVDLNKPLRLLGEDTNGAGNGSTDAIVKPAANDSEVIFITADVEVAGLTVEGINGVDQAVSGIRTADFSTVSTFTSIHDNFIRNVKNLGIKAGLLDNTETTENGITISNNTIQNVSATEGIGIVALHSKGSIDHNHVTGAFIGIATDTSDGVLIDANDIHDSEFGIFIFNSGAAEGDGDVVAGNTIDTGASDASFGIQVLNAANIVSIRDNIISDVNTGIAAFGAAALPNARVEIRSNELSDFVGTTTIGVFLSTDDVGTNPGAGDFEADLLRNTIIGADTGVVVEGLIPGREALVSFIADNEIALGTTGLVLDGPNVSVFGNRLNDTAFSGQTGDYITLWNLAYGDGIPNNQQRQINATAVMFDGKTGFEMTPAERAALEAKLFHEPDLGTLGFIQVDATPATTVSVDNNGTLVIKGTSQDDNVTITGVGIGTGEYIVTTQQGSGPVTTATVIGVTGGFEINLHDGNDHLTMNNVYVAGVIHIEMEEGNDTVILGNQDVVSSGQRLQVGLGNGDDTIDGKRLFIGGDQLIYGGGGDDQLLFNGFASPQFTLGTSAAGPAYWSGDGGNDTVSVVYGFIVQSWAILLGDGSDTLNVFGSAASGDVVFSGDADNDTLTVDTNFFDSTHVILGLGGNDTVLLRAGLGTEFTAIVTGGGSDRVTVRNQTTNQLSVDTGAGQDEVDVQASAFDRFFAQLGDDNDQLTVRANLVQLETALDGGPGSVDRLIDLGNDVRSTLTRSGFELFG